MYIPTHFLETDLAQLDWLAARDAFGTLISAVHGAPFASHLPVLYQRAGDQVTLVGHWAKANPQWQSIEGQCSLFIFHGPHAYISPRWHAQPKQHVPTWNYATAHMYGGVRVIHDPERLAEIVAKLSVQYESGAKTPWRFADSNGKQRLRRIVGFALIAERIEVKFKLNQNHPAEDLAGAIEGLAQESTDDSKAVAALMKTALSKKAV